MRIVSANSRFADLSMSITASSGILIWNFAKWSARTSHPASCSGYYLDTFTLVLALEHDLLDDLDPLIPTSFTVRAEVPLLVNR